MQRVFNVEKWNRLVDGTTVNFPSPLERRVRLDVNCPGECRLSYVDGDGVMTFLGLIKGRDVVEFRAYGEFSLVADGADCWFYTVDGENFAFVLPDAETFTRIIERRPRNPEFEYMHYMMNRNIEARLEQQKHELEQLWARRGAAEAPVAAQPAPASAPSAPAKEPPAPGANEGSGDGEQAAE